MTITCKPGWRVSTAPDTEVTDHTIVTLEREKTPDVWVLHSRYNIAHTADQDPVALVAELFPLAFD